MSNKKKPNITKKPWDKFPWYNDIDEKIRPLVYHLRNYGLNTTGSCSHDGYIIIYDITTISLKPKEVKFWEMPTYVRIYYALTGYYGVGFNDKVQVVSCGPEGQQFWRWEIHLKDKKK